MNCEAIHKMAQSLVEKSGSRNPFVIADSNSIIIKYINDFKTLKGMYMIIKRNRFIFVNTNLPEGIQKVVCAHEIGHDMLHKDYIEGAFHETALFDTKNTFEYEANMFAAEIMIDDKLLKSLAEEGMSIEAIASSLGIDKNIVELKFISMNKRGYKFKLPHTYNSGFLA